MESGSIPDEISVIVQGGKRGPGNPPFYSILHDAFFLNVFLTHRPRRGTKKELGVRSIIKFCLLMVDNPPPNKAAN